MNRCREIIFADNYKICTSFRVDSRKCQNPDHYEDYLKYDALQSLSDGLGTLQFKMYTYVFKIKIII